MKRRVMAILVIGGIAVPLYLVNASWLAKPPEGRPMLIAQRGVHQLFRDGPTDLNACKARSILPPRHAFIENTLPSIKAAFDAGADMVEIDVRETADGEFILFHDAGLECRTDGRGAVSTVSYQQMKHLDVGYGYTADGGKTFPLRGRGRGLMTTVDEMLTAFPARRFLVQFKDGASAGTNFALYIDKRHPDAWKRLALFGDTPGTAEVKKRRPGIWVVHDRQAVKCTFAYLGLGWSGHIPETCMGGTIIVPMAYRYLAWGWPNRFLARMARSGTQVLAIGSVTGLDSTSFTRLDHPEELSALPSGFDGMIWTDRVETIGPAVRQRWPRP
jgi:glycerophosphoryl diester phosphodiesterase